MVARLHLRFALLALALVATGCNASSIPSTPTPIPVPPAPQPPTYRVQRGAVVRGTEFAARVQPAESAELNFGTDGRVRVVNFKGGDAVKKGDVLAELDLTDIRTQLTQATIQFNTAQTVLSETQRSYSRTLELAQLDLNQASLNLQTARARASASNISTLNNDLDRNAVVIADIETSIRRARETGNQAGADNAGKVLKQAQVDREKLQTSYNQALADAKVRDLEVARLENEYRRAVLNLDQKANKLDPNQVQALETARVTVDSLNVKLDKGSLIAPFDGVIAYQPLGLGDNVRALDGNIVVAKPGELELVASLIDTQLNQISVGQLVSITFGNLPDKQFDGYISRVPGFGTSGTTSSQTKDKLVRIVIKSGPALEPGITAQVKTVLGKSENVLWLPPNALRKYRGRSFVVLQEADGRQRRADVLVGLEAAERVEIQDGLKEGDVIVGQQ